jgi:PASTA domain
MSLRVIGSGAAVVGAAQVVVPDVVGFTEAAARAALTEFTVRVRTVETDGTAGTVFAQDPAAAAIRPRRSVVTLFLIVNPPPGNVDIVAALKALTDSVDARETEQAAKGRNDAVLAGLEEIKKNLPPYSGSKGSSSPKSTSS